ncbi:MAG TPA: GntR family transcriptional regulator [Armatimonadota bacterium]|jgi:GntR family transcriptional regulator
MRFDVETTSATPIYAQLIAQVKRAIAGGVLQPGEALPSLRELAAQLRVNPLTVARAYRELEQQGVITTEHGRGSFVSAGAAGLSAAYRREALALAMDRLLAEVSGLDASPEELLALLAERLRADETEEGAPIHYV